MKFILTVMLIITCNQIFAECWNISEFKGYSSRQEDGYKIDKDGMTKKTFQFNVNKSSVSPSNNMECSNVANHSILCKNINNGKSVIAIWSIDLQTNISYYTKSVSGYGQYDGVSMFVGKVIGKCRLK